MKRPCVFFDRDGVVNCSPGQGYVLTWEDFHFVPGIVGVLQKVSDRGFPAVLVTSQRCVAKGLIDIEQLDGIHSRMQDELRKQGADFLDILVCTHTDADKHWAKPGPEMLFEAARRHALDLEQSVLIGDQDRDIQMAQRAGLKAAIRFQSEKPIGIQADFIAHNALELSTILDALLP